MMTTGNYFTETFDKEHIHFGGVIYPSDFETDYRGKDNAESMIAGRILSDFRRENRMVSWYFELKQRKQQAGNA